MKNKTITHKPFLYVSPTLRAEIDTLSRQAVAGTLKRVHSGGKSTITKSGKLALNNGSANAKIRELRVALQADFSALDNEKFDHVFSDAFDLYTLAYSFLWENIIIRGNTRDTLITRKAKDARSQNKTRTVYQWACSAIAQELYRNRHIDPNGKQLYIEDLRVYSDTGEQETATDTTDRLYVKVKKWHDVENIQDVSDINNLLLQLDLTDRQSDILNKRMQGFSVSGIAHALKISQPAVSAHLVKIQAQISKIVPDAVRHFSDGRKPKNV